MLKSPRFGLPPKLVAAASILQVHSDGRLRQNEASNIELLRQLPVFGANLLKQQPVGEIFEPFITGILKNRCHPRISNRYYAVSGSGCWKSILGDLEKGNFRQLSKIVRRSRC